MKKIFIALITVALPYCLLSQTISNVDYNFIDRKIVVYYDLNDCRVGYRYDVDVTFEDDKGNVLIPRNISGDLKFVRCGRNRRVEWDLFKEHNQLEGNYKAVVSIVNTRAISGKTPVRKDTKSHFGVAQWHDGHILLYSSILSVAPFGVKYHYVKSFGVYAALNTDFYVSEEYLIFSAGGSKSIGSSYHIYLGFGADFDSTIPLVELGLLREFNAFGVDLGFGVIQRGVGYVRLGIGSYF